MKGKKEGGALRCESCLHYRQFDDEFCSLRYVVLYVDLSVVFKDNRVNDSEAKAGTPLVLCKIGVKYFFFIFRGNALARIGKFDGSCSPHLLVFCVDAYSAFVSVEGLHGIGNEIDKGPFETIPVYPEGRYSLLLQAKGYVLVKVLIEVYCLLNDDIQIFQGFCL